MLSDRGAIFISIDDNEQANLKLLCDEVFGEKNFIAQVLWHKNYASANDSKTFSSVLDYLLVYRKTDKFLRNLLPRTEKQNHLYKYDSNDGKGRWRPDNLSVRTYSANYDYPITNPMTGKEYNPPKGRSWMTNKDKVDEWINETRVYFGLDGKGAPQLKRYLSEVQQGVVPTTYWSYDDCGHNDEARKELKDIFEHPPFDSPKPTRLLKQIIQVASADKNITVLDFFAGSGTTLHAVMQLNEGDEGRRQCILCQINEANICRDVTYERNRRVMQGYQDSKGNEVGGLGNSLKYYRTAFVGKNQPKAATDDDKLALARKAGCLLGLAENTLYERLATEYYQLYTDEQGRWTCIYFQEDYSHFEEFRQRVVALEGGQKNVYVFSWTDGVEFAAEFEFENNVSVKSIPQPILDIYKSLNA